MLGVKRNLWATQQSGLYAPKRMNFPLDSPELYLPLWHPELSGSPIISKDLNAVSCTVTGAVHVPPTHRAFDGDDFINIGTGVNINGTQSFGAWFKYGSYTNTDILISNTSGGILAGLALRLLNATTLRITLNINDLYYQLSKTVAVDTWYFPMITFDLPTTTLVFYLNGGNADTDVTGVSTARSVGNMEIGRRPNPAGHNYLTDGAIGEVWFYSPVLTAREVFHIYDATKWRYQ